MIFESYYWKNNLRRNATSIKSRIANQKIWRDASLAILEQEIILSFYSIRKLLESKKVTDELKHKFIPTKCYKRLGDGNINYYNWHDIDKHYALQTQESNNVKIKDICNLIIHSYIFIFNFNDTNSPYSVFFNSDYTKNEQLYELELASIIDIFLIVSEDYPQKVTSYYKDNELILKVE